MPKYTFKNTETGEEFDEYMSIAAREEFLEQNPHIIQLIVSAPGFIYDNHNLTNKVPPGFRDVLKQIKKQNPGSTIDSGNIGSL
ncbi:putative Com-like regulatory protein [Ochrobactrum phage vB_OspM_OC]|nr:putative Com-like regulatory protein [Ochrobactrum phage vB_OspM_OC]